MKDVEKVFRYRGEKIFSEGNELVEPEGRLEVEEMVDWYLRENVSSAKGHEWKGYHLIPGFEADTAKYAYNVFTPKPGEVLVATYAKTGVFCARNVYEFLKKCYGRYLGKACLREITCHGRNMFSNYRK